MNELNNNAETQLGGLSIQSYSCGYDLSSNMASGIESGAGKVRASIQGLAQYVQNNWGHSHPTEGPMKDDDKWMPDFMDNLVNGIDNNRYRVEDAIDRTASSLAEIGSDMDVPDFNTNVTANGGDIVIPLYLDGSIIDERIVTAQQIHDYRSGGR